MDSTVPRQEVHTQAHADIWQETQVVNVYKVDRQDRDKERVRQESHVMNVYKVDRQDRNKERVSKSMYVHYFIEVLSKATTRAKKHVLDRHPEGEPRDRDKKCAHEYPRYLFP